MLKIADCKINDPVDEQGHGGNGLGYAMMES
jgi:hypothetical protein